MLVDKASGRSLGPSKDLAACSRFENVAEHRYWESLISLMVV